MLLLAVVALATTAALRTGSGAATPSGPPPTVGSLVKSGASFGRDVRTLPQLPTRAKPVRPERESPPTPLNGDTPTAPIGSGTAPTSVSAPAPAASRSFDGLRFGDTCGGVQCGQGHPPDTNGDVGPTYYIQTINTAIGIFDKSTGTRVAAFSFDALMSQGSFGNLCDTDNYGDPVVLYDTFVDRWVITDFAFQLDAQGNIPNPPGTFQCFAVSKTGNPVSGGWNFYSVPVEGGIGDYPKLGAWSDGIYMSANMFGYSVTSSFQNARVWAFDKSAMYAGSPTAGLVSFDLPARITGVPIFSLLPANARLQTGAPPDG